MGTWTTLFTAVAKASIVVKITGETATAFEPRLSRASPAPPGRRQG
jgi:hypothetical protein